MKVDTDTTSSLKVPPVPPVEMETDSSATKETKHEKQSMPACGPELDLAFALDSTGSMGSYIHSATESIQGIVNKLVQTDSVSMRFSLIVYRDHPPQDSTFVTKVYPFTSSTATMKKQLADQSASGGGDGPEAVTAALHAALHLPWRPNATKIVVIIADAPPHGLGEHGDGFPNGDPDGRDPLHIAREMKTHGVTLFSVACEPALSSYRFAVDFFAAIAATTGGSLLPLTSATLLPAVIVGGVQEQLDMERLVEAARKEVEAARLSGVSDEEEVKRRVHGALKAAGAQTRQVKVTDIYDEGAKKLAEQNVAMFGGAVSLAAAVPQMKEVQGRLKAEALGGGGGGVFACSMMAAGSPRMMAAPAPALRAAKGGMLSRMRMFGAAMPKSTAPMPRSAAADMAPGAPPGAAEECAVAACAAPAAAEAFCMPQGAARPMVQTVEVDEGEVTMEQVARLMKKL